MFNNLGCSYQSRKYTVSVGYRLLSKKINKYVRTILEIGGEQAYTRCMEYWTWIVKVVRWMCKPQKWSKYLANKRMPITFSLFYRPHICLFFESRNRWYAETSAWEQLGRRQLQKLMFHVKVSIHDSAKSCSVALRGIRKTVAVCFRTHCAGRFSNRHCIKKSLYLQDTGSLKFDSILYT